MSNSKSVCHPILMLTKMRRSRSLAGWPRVLEWECHVSAGGEETGQDLGRVLRTGVEVVPWESSSSPTKQQTDTSHSPGRLQAAVMKRSTRVRR